MIVLTTSKAAYLFLCEQFQIVSIGLYIVTQLHLN